MDPVDFARIAELLPQLPDTLHDARETAETVERIAPVIDRWVTIIGVSLLAIAIIIVLAIIV